MSHSARTFAEETFLIGMRDSPRLFEEKRRRWCRRSPEKEGHILPSFRAWPQHVRNGNYPRSRVPSLEIHKSGSFQRRSSCRCFLPSFLPCLRGPAKSFQKVDDEMDRRMAACSLSCAWVPLANGDPRRKLISIRQLIAPEECARTADAGPRRHLMSFHKLADRVSSRCFGAVRY